MSKEFQDIFQIRISLVGILPPIWRTIQVPMTYTFWDLHVAIQDCMGWLDYHLHEFTVFDFQSNSIKNVGIPDEEFPESHPVPEGWEVPIMNFLHEDSPTARYEYDFGDSWVHVIQIEAQLNRDSKNKYPLCIDGARRCPPEDCGGVGGYEHFLKVISDKKDPEHESMLEWAGGSFDPEEFDISKVIFDNPKTRWKIAFQEPDM